MTKSNWWIVGYNAAMQAAKPSEINDAIANAGEASDFQRELFRKGWRSVWACERKQEAEEIIAALDKAAIAGGAS